jgi:hypothetical protein
VRVEGLSQMGSKLENLFFNKHPFARDGLRTECRGGLEGRLLSRGQGTAAVDRTQSARATKYIEFHDSVKLPHVYLPAHNLHNTERALQRLVAATRCGSRGGSYGSWCKFKYSYDAVSS